MQIGKMMWMSAGFFLVDIALVAALPRLGLSFGPLRAALMALGTVRLGLLLVWTMASIFTDLRPWANGFLIAANLLVTCLLIYSMYFEPFYLTTGQMELTTPALKPGTRVRIVQISDLHIERVTRRERTLLNTVQGLHPDLIVLTGDYLNLSYLRDPQSLKDLHWVLENLHAPLGVYAINGNMESIQKTRQELAGMDQIHLLDDTLQTVQTAGGEIELLGLTDSNSWKQDGARLEKLAGQASNERYRILLYHTPDLIYTAANSGVNLYFAGHTHGGQICLPFYGAMITFSRFGKAYEQGRHQMGPTTLYVSRGLGMEGGAAPRARFLAPPEVVVVDLVGK
jgi:predicted MPP superfamily phosphohydrolase